MGYQVMIEIVDTLEREAEANDRRAWMKAACGDREVRLRAVYDKRRNVVADGVAAILASIDHEEITPGCILMHGGIEDVCDRLKEYWLEPNATTLFHLRSAVEAMPKT